MSNSQNTGKKENDKPTVEPGKSRKRLLTTIAQLQNELDLSTSALDTARKEIEQEKKKTHAGEEIGRQLLLVLQRKIINLTDTFESLNDGLITTRQELAVERQKRQEAENRAAEIEENLHRQIAEIESNAFNAARQLIAAREKTTSANAETAATLKTAQAKETLEYEKKLKNLKKQLDAEKIEQLSIQKDSYAREQTLMNKMISLETKLAESVNTLKIPQQKLKDLTNKLQAERDKTTQPENSNTPPVIHYAAGHRKEKQAPDSTPARAPADTPAKPAKFFLRLPDSSILDSVSMIDLSAWAVSCRIGPDYMISADKMKWTFVCDLPELQMEWMVELIDGTSYGPINMLAVPQLVLHGVAALNAKLRHKITGQILHADKLNPSGP